MDIRSLIINWTYGGISDEELSSIANDNEFTVIQADDYIIVSGKVNFILELESIGF